MKILGVIPSRYNSTRFPGKPLVDIAGKSMVRRVYEQASSAGRLDEVLVATDDERIFSHVKDFNGQVMMTSVTHANGTERCAEVLEEIDGDFDFVINIQGDEPFIKPEQIDLLATKVNRSAQLATLIRKEYDLSLLNDPNTIKVTIGGNDSATHFTRLNVPVIRSGGSFFYRHIGIYAYRSDILPIIARLPASRLEKEESLEQLRWLENGFSIKVVETDINSSSIDTPEDLKRILSDRII